MEQNTFASEADFAQHLKQLSEQALKDFLISLPTQVRKRVGALKNLQKSSKDLEKQYRDEITALEKKYQNLYQPLFEKRSQIVNGQHEPTDEESHFEGEEALPPKEEKEEDVNGIPKFWLTVLKNDDHVSDTITEEDEEALTHLKDIKCTLLEGDKQGFTLIFEFNENPFFEETVLTKTYFLEDDEQYGELVFDHAIATPITWKQGKNLTVKIVKKKSKAKGRGNKKPVVQTKEEPCPSFFNFFNPPTWEEDVDENDEEALDAMMEEDFDMGCQFKDKIIRQAVLYFTGEVAPVDFGGEDFDDEDEDEDEDEDDDDEEIDLPRGGGGGRGGRGGRGGKGGRPAPPTGTSIAKPGAAQPECKQQ